MSVQPPGRELNAHAGRCGGALVTIGSLGSSSTKLSTPLAYPSTLDRRPAAASYVEGCWSPVLARCHCKLGMRK